jgi:hypothetical protein
MTRTGSLPTGVATVATSEAYPARHAVRIGLASVVRVCQGPGDLVILEDGAPFTYVAAAMSVGEVAIGTVPSITVRLADVGNVLSDADVAGTLIGSTLTVVEIHWDAGGVQLDPVVLFAGTIAYAKYALQAVEISAARSGSTSAGMVGRIISRLCTYRFQGARCGYSGAGTSCDHTMVACAAYSNINRYGGWPSMPQLGQKFSYTVTTSQPPTQRAGAVSPAPKPPEPPDKISTQKPRKRLLRA